jgi:SAM-dependent methyltransferase
MNELHLEESTLAGSRKRPVTSDRLAGRYKWAFAFMPRSSVVVDIGASVSPLSYVLQQKADVVIAVDVERSALLDLKATGASVLPIEASSSVLPIRTGSVDIALLLDVLEHVTNEEGTINEIHRAVRPGGFLILSVPNKGLFQFLDPQNIRLRIDGKLDESSKHRHYSYAELMRFLQPRFRVIRRHYGGLFLYPLMFASDNFVRKHLRRDWGRFFRKVSDRDNDISWGRLSYNLIVLAQRLDLTIENRTE